MKKSVIYKSYGMYSLEELKEEEKQAIEILKENGIEEPTQEDITQELWNNSDRWYEDEHDNLNKTLDGRVIAIADIGRWNGRVQGYKIFKDNLNEVLNNIGCDVIEVYCDRYNVKAHGHHHDGSNCVEYREVREDRDIDKLLNMIYSNEKITRSTLNYYTKSLRPYIAEIYGI